MNQIYKGIIKFKRNIKNLISMRTIVPLFLDYYHNLLAIVSTGFHQVIVDANIFQGISTGQFIQSDHRDRCLSSVHFKGYLMKLLFSATLFSYA